MKNLIDILHLDESYTTLHYGNFRKCISDHEKERYKKQLCNMMTRRNSIIQHQICLYHRDYHSYSWRHVRKRVTKSRNTSLNRPVPRTQCATTPNHLPTEPFKPPTAINVSCQEVDLQLQLPQQPKNSYQCLTTLQRNIVERRSHLLNNSKNNSSQGLTMVGIKVYNYNSTIKSLKVDQKSENISSKIRSIEKRLYHYNPEEKENQKVLPGILRNKEALIKLSTNSISQKEPVRETCRQKLMQGLLYLERIHQRAEECILLGHKVTIG